MSVENERLQNSEELRTLLILLRFSGKNQSECAEILNLSRSTISSEEQEERYKEKLSALTSILARLVLPSKYHHHFADPQNERNDLERMKKGLYV